MKTTLAELEAEALRFRDAREWARFHTPKNLAMAIAGEAGELCELFQWKDEAEITALLGEPAFREKVAHELADLQILLLFAARAAGVALDEAVRHKMAINAERYPVEKARGNAKKYDEL
jgi:dCTP diphosphatase